MWTKEVIKWLLKKAKTVTPNFALKKQTNTIVSLLRLEFTGHFVYQNCIETALNYVHFWAYVFQDEVQIQKILAACGRPHMSYS